MEPSSATGPLEAKHRDSALCVDAGDQQRGAVSVGAGAGAVKPREAYVALLASETASLSLSESTSDTTAVGETLTTCFFLLRWRRFLGADSAFKSATLIPASSGWGFFGGPARATKDAGSTPFPESCAG